MTDPSLRADPAFVPVLIRDLELSEPLGHIAPAATADGVPFGRARILVRIHTRPMGFIELEINREGIPPESLAGAIEAELGSIVRRHLQGDVNDAVGSITAKGIPMVDEPACLSARRKILRAPPSMTVVVPTIDRPGALRLCLQDLIDQEFPPFEILVVDNGPDQSGAEAVVASLNPRGRTLRYLVEPQRGASRARNRGLRAAQGEIVSFVDGDLRVDRWWLASVATAMQTRVDHDPADGEVAASCVTGAILPTNLETPAQRWMEEWGGYSKGFERRAYDLREHRLPNPLYPFAAVFGSGANMSFRTFELRRLGGFDVALGGGTMSRGGEDLAAFLDIVRSGRKLVYEPAAIVWHEHPRTEAQFRSRLQSYGIGLTSFLLRHTWRHPVDAIRIAMAMPAAAAYFFRSDSPKNERRSQTFPRGMWATEMAGMIQGPFAYAAGRARIHRKLR